tara:strand:+ start:1453 stop:1893 length:441 start_codon:yes stop_codon:yes gene_type:complete
MIKNIVSILIISVFAIGCENPVATLQSEVPGYQPTPVLDIYCDNCTTDEEGNLYYEYTGHNYGQINFYVEATMYPFLIGWTSPHEYCVDHHGTEICEPVINYQTYTDDDGYGHQNFYMNETFKGQTLQLVGYINAYNYDVIYITIH